MAFKRSAVRSRLSPPKCVDKKDTRKKHRTEVRCFYYFGGLQEKSAQQKFVCRNQSKIFQGRALGRYKIHFLRGGVFRTPPHSTKAYKNKIKPSVGFRMKPTGGFFHFPRRCSLWCLCFVCSAFLGGVDNSFSLVFTVPAKAQAEKNHPKKGKSHER